MSIHSPSFVVTTLVRGNARSQVWESGAPLALGFPSRWALERSAGGGLRIRDLSAPLDRLEKGRIHEIPSESLSLGPCEVELPGCRVRVRRARTLPPVSEQAPTGRQLRIYPCAGAWVLESRALRERYEAVAHGREVFEIRDLGESCLLTSRVDGLKLAVAGGLTQLVNAGEKAEVAKSELARALVTQPVPGSAGIRSWRFGLTDGTVIPAPTAATDTALTEDIENFRKALRAALIALAAVIALSWLWPRPREDARELIPPQFAKIVLTRLPRTRENASASPGSGAASARIPAKVRDAAVVRAFRARALNQAISGLLKGGISRFLAQSELMAGAARSARAGNLFNSRPDALRAPGIAEGAGTAPRAVRIASLGGLGNGSAGPGVGYVRGRRGGVKGQGRGFVPFVAADADGSAVDEGLTRDEVGEVIRRHLSEVRYCYESAMIRMPDIEGKLLTAFTINGGGAVRSADVKSSTLPDPRLDDCILRRLVTWRFPRPRGGVDVAVSYPFIFKTLGR